jgi:hypothetical protein
MYIPSIWFERNFLDMLNIFSIKQARPGEGATSDVGTKKTSAALLRVTKGYLFSSFELNLYMIFI